MKKKEYMAPILELMECRVEKGFAGSFGGETGENNAPQMQQFDDGGTIGGNLFN